MSEAITLLGGLKTPISTQYSEADAITSCILPDSSIVSGKYVTGIDATGAANACSLVATLGANVSRKVQAATVTQVFVPLTGVWTCTTSITATFPEVVPSACKP
ncbi:MAG: pilin [Burkholderiales bacterium]